MHRRRTCEPSGGDFCGLNSNLNFGRPVFNTTYDPDTLTGWGKRAYDWNFGIQVQQELLPRVSVNVGYFRRVFGNFFVTDNRATRTTDYDTFSITAPADPRLPGGGNYTDLQPVQRDCGALGRDRQLPDVLGRLRRSSDGTGTASRSTSRRASEAA